MGVSRKKLSTRDFPGGPMVRTLTAESPGSVVGWGTKIPQAEWHIQKTQRLFI